MRKRTIQYAVDSVSGMVWSRVYGEGYAIPVLDYEGMTPENSFEMNYNLEKVTDVGWNEGLKYLKWTRKIPKEIKNLHRRFWGFKELN